MIENIMESHRAIFLQLNFIDKYYGNKMYGKDEMLVDLRSLIRTHIRDAEEERE